MGLPIAWLNSDRPSEWQRPEANTVAASNQQATPRQTVAGRGANEDGQPPRPIPGRNQTVMSPEQRLVELVELLREHDQRLQFLRRRLDAFASYVIVDEQFVIADSLDALAEMATNSERLSGRLYGLDQLLVVMPNMPVDSLSARLEAFEQSISEMLGSPLSAFYDLVDHLESPDLQMPQSILELLYRDAVDEAAAYHAGIPRQIQGAQDPAFAVFGRPQPPPYPGGGGLDDAVRRRLRPRPNLQEQMAAEAAPTNPNRIFRFPVEATADNATGNAGAATHPPENHERHHFRSGQGSRRNAMVVVGNLPGMSHRAVFPEDSSLDLRDHLTATPAAATRSSSTISDHSLAEDDDSTRGMVASHHGGPSQGEEYHHHEGRPESPQPAFLFGPPDLPSLGREPGTDFWTEARSNWGFSPMALQVIIAGTLGVFGGGGSDVHASVDEIFTYLILRGFTSHLTADQVIEARREWREILRRATEERCRWLRHGFTLAATPIGSEIARDFSFAIYPSLPDQIVPPEDDDYWL